MKKIKIAKNVKKTSKDVLTRVRDITKVIAETECIQLPLQILYSANKVAKGATTESEVFGSIVRTAKTTAILEAIVIGTDVIIWVVEKKSGKKAFKKDQEKDTVEDEIYDLDTDEDDWIADDLDAAAEKAIKEELENQEFEESPNPEPNPA